MPDGPLLPFALAMPEEYQYRYDDSLSVWDKPIVAYRAYYRAEKCGYWRQPRDPAKPSVWVPAKWTKRDPPGWF